MKIKKERKDKGKPRRNKVLVRKMYAAGATYREIRTTCTVCTITIRHYCQDLLKDPEIQAKRREFAGNRSGKPLMHEYNPQKVKDIQNLFATGFPRYQIADMLRVSLKVIRRYITKEQMDGRNNEG